MSFGIDYQAIPVESELFRLLEEDRMAELLFLRLWFYPKPLNVRETDPEEVEELLDEVVESFSLEDRDTADQTLARLEAVIARTCEIDPDLWVRKASFENFDRGLELRIIQWFQEREIEDPGEWAGKLLFGETILAPKTRFPNDSLSLIRPETVKRAARQVSEIDPDSFDDTGNLDLSEELRRLIVLYGEAAAHGEAILVLGQN